MSNSDNGGGLLVFMYLLTIAISIASGVLAWNWIEPDSFFGAIAFLIVWAVFSKIGHFIAMGIVAAFGGMD